MIVPFNDLFRNIPDVTEVVNSGNYLNGPYLEKFEKAFAEYLGVEDFVGVGSGFDALQIAIQLADKDELIIPPNVGMYATQAALRCGVSVVMKDVGKNLLLPYQERPAIVTHLYGMIAESNIIEDCSHLHARYTPKGIGVYSFYPTKNLGCIGNGGGLALKDGSKARMLRQYGWSKKYHSDMLGIHSQLDEINAYVLLERLKTLDEKNERRRQIRNYYREQSSISFVGGDYIPHLCVVMSHDRQALREKLKNKGISTEIHYPIPDYKQKIINKDLNMPNTEYACNHILSIPCFPEMTDTEVEYVANSLKDVY